MCNHFLSKSGSILNFSVNFRFKPLSEQYCFTFHCFKNVSPRQCYWILAPRLAWDISIKRITYLLFACLINELVLVYYCKVISI